MSYKVNINDFEGPLDLLLFFIRRDKLNIYDISISKITNDFLDHISILNQMNIEVGGEFIHMASLLMKIKSKMLLPKDELDIEDDIDPRQDLILKLLEYKKFKDISDHLSDIKDDYSNRHKTKIKEKYKTINNEHDFSVGNFNLNHIIKTYSHLINQLPDVNPYELDNDKFSVQEQIELLKEEMGNKSKISFKHIIKIAKSKIQIIYLFIAILEMIRNREIKVEQKESFSEIYIINNIN